MNAEFTLDAALVPIVEAVVATLGSRGITLIGGAVLTGYDFIDRTTDDLDFCVVAADDEATAVLGASADWERVKGHAIRWKHAQHGWQIDVLPHQPGDESPLPLAEDRVLSRVGMAHLAQAAHTVEGLPAQVRCAPIYAIALLKMVAWGENRWRRDKDAADIRRILENYEAYTDRLFDAWHVYQQVEECGLAQYGAYLLGQDMASIASDAAKAAVRDFIDQNQQHPNNVLDPRHPFLVLLPWCLKGFKAQ